MDYFGENTKEGVLTCDRNAFAVGGILCELHHKDFCTFCLGHAYGCDTTGCIGGMVSQ